MPDTFCGHKTSNCWWWQRKWDKKRRKYFRSNLCHFWQVTQQDLYKKVHDVQLCCQTSLLEVEGNPFLQSLSSSSSSYFSISPLFRCLPFVSLSPFCSTSCSTCLCLPTPASPATPVAGRKERLQLVRKMMEDVDGSDDDVDVVASKVMMMKTNLQQLKKSSNKQIQACWSPRLLCSKRRSSPLQHVTQIRHFLGKTMFLQCLRKVNCL